MAIRADVAQIRYDLSRLRSRNGHHLFEEICLHFASQRISRCILPATGPVGAGGDQGRDFETFQSFITENGSTIAFACTLQSKDVKAKIKTDVEKILAGPPVDIIYFFTEADLPKGERHELQRWASDRTKLEIIDGNALAQHLAQPELCWIAEQYLGVSSRSAAQPRRGLPRRQPLVGRRTEIERGKTLLAQRERPALVVHGPPGVGKTAFAEHLAWSVEAAFPGGVVVVEVPELEDLLALVLLALDPGTQVPGDRHQQLARLGALLAGPRLLLLLDNVRSEESLTDLLRVDGAFAIVCTSRSRMTGLALEDVAAVEIEPLRQEDAAQLAKAVAERMTDEECITLATVCGGLPIAVLIASARIQKRPQLSVRDYLGELADPDHGMEELRAGAKSVERIIEDSYRLLEADHARLFAALGLLPSTSVTVDVIATARADNITELAKEQLLSARRLLDDLVELHLVEQIDQDRFRLHDILYRFARHKAATSDRAWRDRIIAHACLAYAARTDVAVRSIGYVDGEARIPSEGNMKALDDLEQDHAGAVALVESATARELWDEVMSLARALTPALEHLGRWGELARIYKCVQEAGVRTGETEWQATALLNLGVAAARKGDTDEAIALYRESFDRATTARHLWLAEAARSAYGGLLMDMGHAAAAIPVLRQGLYLWRVLEHDLMLALTLNSLGKANLAVARWKRAEAYFRNALRVVRRARIGGLLAPFGVVLATVLRLTGRSAAARQECETALERARAVGNRETEADALRELALIKDALGDNESLLDTLTSALEIYREVGDVRSQASTLLLLGNAAEELGDREQAMRHFAHCAELAERTNDLRHLANAMAQIANLYGEAGRHEQADEYLMYAIEAAEQSGSDLLVLQVQHQQAHMLRRVGRIDQVVPLLRRNVRLLEKTGESDALATARARLGEALMQQGEWQEAVLILRSVTEAPTDAASPRVRASAFRFLAALYSRRKLWPEATYAADRALALAEESCSRSERMHCYHTMGTVLGRMSKWPEAAVEFERAADLAAELQDFQTMVIIRSNQASCMMRSGDNVKAIATMRWAVQVAEELGLDDLHASLRINIGASLAKQKDIDAAVPEFERAHQIASALNNSDLIATAAESLASAQVSKGDLATALRWIHDARLQRQQTGDMRAAAEAFETEVIVRMTIAQEAGENTYQLAIPDDVPKPLLTALRARRAAFPMATDLPQTEQVSDRRTLVVAQEIIDELADVKLDAIYARLATGRRHCVACGLPLAEDGPAHMVLVQFPQGPHAISLAHPTCAPSSVMCTNETASPSTVRFEIECYLWGGTMAGVIVDARGPWGAAEDSEPVDLFLESLRKVGFADIGGSAKPPQAPRVPELAKEAVYADLIGDKLTIMHGETPITPALPLSFLPHWYRAARSGALLVMFGHDLRGMVADDPSYFIKAAEEGHLVGAALTVNVVPPARSRPCVCTPRTELKFKHCCGANRT